MNCLKCGTETTNPMFCSKSCSASHNNKSTKRIDKITYCEFCGKELVGKNRLRVKHCNQQCNTDDRNQKAKQRFLSGKVTNHTTLLRVTKLVLQHECSICHITEWCNKPIMLIMDHIDGNSYNNSPTNIRLVCSNCDSQLPTYKIKNKGNGRHSRMQRYHNNQSY